MHTHTRARVERGRGETVVCTKPATYIKRKYEDETAPHEIQKRTKKTNKKKYVNESGSSAATKIQRQFGTYSRCTATETRREEDEHEFFVFFVHLLRTIFSVSFFCVWMCVCVCCSFHSISSFIDVFGWHATTDETASKAAAKRTAQPTPHWTCIWIYAENTHTASKKREQQLENAKIRNGAEGASTLSISASRSPADYFSCSINFLRVCAPVVRSSNFIFWLCACQRTKKNIRSAGVAWRHYWITKRTEERWRRRRAENARSMCTARTTCWRCFRIYLYMRFTTRSASQPLCPHWTYVFMASCAYMKNRLRVSHVACRMGPHERCILSFSALSAGEMHSIFEMGTTR